MTNRQLVSAVLLSLGFAGLSQADHPSLNVSTGTSGPINTISAVPLERGQLTVSVRTEAIEFDAFSDTELAGFAAGGQEGIHSVDQLTSTSVGLGYGMTDDVTLSMRIPYVDRENIRESELEDGKPEAHGHGDASGFGDIVLLGQYRFYHQDSSDAAVLFGLKAPTGETDVEDDGEHLETEFQPGSGSWDLLLGGAWTRQSGRTGIHASVLYSLTGEGSQDTVLGDVFFYNLALSYRLAGEHSHTEGTGDHSHIAWDLLVELNGENREKEEIGGIKDPNSGGTQVFLSPGIRLASGSGWGAFVSVGVPVLDDLNGLQADTDYRIVGGVGLGF